MLCTVIDPLWGPVAIGAKVTVMVQLTPGARVAPQVLVWVNGPLDLLGIQAGFAASEEFFQKVTP